MGAVPQMKRFHVSGIFEAGYNEYDRGMAFVHMQDLQRVQRMGEGVTGVRLRMHDMDQAWEVARDLALSLGGAVPREFVGRRKTRTCSVRSRWKRPSWRSCCR